MESFQEQKDIPFCSKKKQELRRELMRRKRQDPEFRKLENKRRRDLYAANKKAMQGNDSLIKQECMFENQSISFISSNDCLYKQKESTYRTILPLVKKTSSTSEKSDIIEKEGQEECAPEYSILKKSLEDAKTAKVSEIKRDPADFEEPVVGLDYHPVVTTTSDNCINESSNKTILPLVNSFDATSSTPEISDKNRMKYLDQKLRRVENEHTLKQKLEKERTQLAVFNLEIPIPSTFSNSSTYNEELSSKRSVSPLVDFHDSSTSYSSEQSKESEIMQLSVFDLEIPIPTTSLNSYNEELSDERTNLSSNNFRDSTSFTSEPAKVSEIKQLPVFEFKNQIPSTSSNKQNNRTYNKELTTAERMGNIRRDPEYTKWENEHCEVLNALKNKFFNENQSKVSTSSTLEQARESEISQFAVFDLEIPIPSTSSNSYVHNEELSIERTSLSSDNFHDQTSCTSEQTRVSELFVLDFNNKIPSTSLNNCTYNKELSIERTILPSVNLRDSSKERMRRLRQDPEYRKAENERKRRQRFVEFVRKKLLEKEEQVKASSKIFPVSLFDSEMPIRNVSSNNKESIERTSLSSDNFHDQTSCTSEQTRVSEFPVLDFNNKIPSTSFKNCTHNKELSIERTISPSVNSRDSSMERMRRLRQDPEYRKAENERRRRQRFLLKKLLEKEEQVKASSKILPVSLFDSEIPIPTNKELSTGITLLPLDSDRAPNFIFPKSNLGLVSKNSKLKKISVATQTHPGDLKKFPCPIIIGKSTQTELDTKDANTQTIVIIWNDSIANKL